MEDHPEKIIPPEHRDIYTEMYKIEVQLSGRIKELEDWIDKHEYAIMELERKNGL